MRTFYIGKNGLQYKSKTILSIRCSVYKVLYALESIRDGSVARGGAEGTTFYLVPMPSRAQRADVMTIVITCYNYVNHSYVGMFSSLYCPSKRPPTEQTCVSCAAL